MMDIPSARHGRCGKGYLVLLKDVWKQAKGSDLQSGYSFVYVWLANQFGHFMIGFAGTILLCWIVSLVCPSALAGQEFWPRLGVAAAIGIVWLLGWIAKEVLIDVVGGMRLLKRAVAQREAACAGAAMPDRKPSAQDNIGIKRLIGEALSAHRNVKRGLSDNDEDWFVYDIVRDSFSDGRFYLAGALTAVVMYAAPGLAQDGGWLWLWLAPLAAFVATFVMVLALLVFVSRDWLAEKVAFDLAALPFVGRFALNSRPYQPDKRAIVIGFATGARAAKHLVIIGPPKSGRTRTAVALGVESLLRSGNSTVLYTTWCKLLDGVAEEKYVGPQDEQFQGRELRPTFPPAEVELLIIDDVGAEGAGSQPFVTAMAFGNELNRNSALREKLKDKRLVWVVGDNPSNRADWITALERVFGSGTVEAVEPGQTIPYAERYPSRHAA